MRPSILPFFTLSSTLSIYFVFLTVLIVTNSLIRDVYKEEMITFCYVYKVVVKNNKSERKKNESGYSILVVAKNVVDVL